MKKRIISLLLILALGFSLCAGAAAALTPEVSPAGISAGESVTVTLRVKAKMTGVTALDYRVYYDPEVFTLTGGVRGAASTLTVLSSARTDPAGQAYYDVSIVDPASAGVTVKAGVLYTLTFRARADVAEDVTAAFRVTRHAYMNRQFSPAYTDDVTGGDLTVTVARSPRAAVRSASLTLAGEIGVNFYVALPDEVAQDAGAYAVFTFKGAEGTHIPVSSVPTDTQSGVTRHIFTCRTAAKEMTEQIALRIYTGSGAQVMLTNASGAVMSGGAARYSVAKYVKNVTSAAGKALARKLGSFGARSMTYFGYTPVEEDTSAADAIAPVTESGVTSAALLPYKTTSSGSVTGLSVKSLSLTLETLTSVNLSFAVSGGHAIGEYRFALNGADVTNRIYRSDGRYYLTIPNIPAKELDTVYTVTVTRGSEALTLTCSALSYAYSTLKTNENNADKAALCDLVRSLYAYSLQADEYFA